MKSRWCFTLCFSVGWQCWAFLMYSLAICPSSEKGLFLLVTQVLPGSLTLLWHLTF